MNPRFSTVSRAGLSKFERMGGGKTLPKGKREQDYLAIVLWSLIVIFGLQGIYAGLPSALAWVALGVLMLIVKQQLSIRLLLLVEAPMFFAIICYSVSAIYLAQEEGDHSFFSSAAVAASWLAWWAMAFFTAGLIVALKWGNKLFSNAQNIIPVTTKYAMWIAAFGLLCNEVLVKIVPSSIWNAIYVFGYCSPIGLFLLFKIWTEKDPYWIRTWKFWVWFAALVLWALHSVTGGIFGSTILILMLFSSEYTQRSKLVLVGFILVTAIMAPLLQDAKADYRRKIAEDVTQKEKKLFEVFSDNFNRVFVQGEVGAYRQGITNLAGRLCIFEIWFAVRQHVDRHQDFAEGQTIKDSLLEGFVPRPVWPIIFGGAEKPKRGGSSDLARQYAEMPVVEGTSVGVGMISEFYINYGTSGAIIGMLLLGCLGGFVLAFGVNDRVQPLGLGMCIVVFSCFVRPETNFSDMLGGIIRLIFLWWALRAWILFRHRRLQPAIPQQKRRVGSF